MGYTFHWFNWFCRHYFTKRIGVFFISITKTLENHIGFNFIESMAVSWIQTKN